MKLSERFNNFVTGAISGLVIPLIAYMVFYFSTSHGLNLKQYWERTVEVGNLTQIMSVSVFANIIIFLIFNHFDMLRSSKGVLGITIIWAFVVFGIKLF